jgi:hypothetical protein
MDNRKGSLSDNSISKYNSSRNYKTAAFTIAATTAAASIDVGGEKSGVGRLDCPTKLKGSNRQQA